ncbi:uncharacterized protein [Epargyreus clarus]|uniref:uncharacterized protein n=1 Tax=Epargyreus clarus TaxID=520877 RepID=UPI003C2B58CF
MNGELNGQVEETSKMSVAGPDTALHAKIGPSPESNVEVNDCEPSVTENHIETSPNILEDSAECSTNGNITQTDEKPCLSEESVAQPAERESPRESDKCDIIENNCNKIEDTSPAIDATPETKPDGDEVQKDASAIIADEPMEEDHRGLETAEPMESDDINSELVSSDESEVSAGPRAEDTVSINSDSGAEGGDDTSQESQSKLKNNELIMVGKEKRPSNQNGNTCESPSPEVHEIVSDNEENMATVQNKAVKLPENKTPLRRSSRAIKRKRYDDHIANGDDDSDIEEIGISEPYRRRSRPIVINDTKTLVEMAARQMKSNQGGHHRKEPTVVIIDTNSSLSVKTPATHQHHQRHSAVASSSSISAQNLYQSIVARGTTVTPVPAKTNASTQSPSPSPSPSPQPSILPSLTDDMFVVEAPSFIVPYVYEKPSIKPFREFVDVLGNELAEQRAKEEKLELEKREQEKREKIERGETVENSDEECGDKENDLSEKEQSDEKNKKQSTEGEEITADDDKKKKKAEKRELRKRQNDDDDLSWDGESSSESDDDIGSDEEDKTVVIKDKVDTVTDLKDVTDLTVEKVVSGKSDNYFDCSLGKFFMNIGLNLVQEFVQKDLLKQQNRKLYKEKKSGQDTKLTESSIMSLGKNLEFSKENNAPYTFTMKKCTRCNFKTESSLVISHHMESPHMKNNIYKCSYCEFEIRSPHDILFHMEAQHKVRGKLERLPSYHQCANCPFEDNGKGKLARHLIACAKKFKPDFNLSPPVEWEPPAKIPKHLMRSRNTMMSPYQNSFQRGQVGNNVGRPPISNIIAGLSTSYRPRGRSPMTIVPRSTTVQGTPILRGGVMIRHSNPSLLNNYPIGNNGKTIPIPKSIHQPSISITPLPRQPPPTPVPQQQQQQNSTTKNSCVICEICDGYIKDLEQLRNHMQWIHKVKIHPKMIYNRPPLNCQKCQFRFFTDQGLERHLLGSHGLVTSCMQEAANKGKDAGRCPVCGRIYQWKLLNHVSRDHNLTLKPAHLSYKCTVCAATFSMYKQFENHVYSAHSVVAKRAMDKTKPATNEMRQVEAGMKPLKINDEITIIPQPVRVPPSATATATTTATTTAASTADDDNEK